MIQKAERRCEERVIEPSKNAMKSVTQAETRKMS